VSLFRRPPSSNAGKPQHAIRTAATPMLPAEGVPPWARVSLVQWLLPILHAVQEPNFSSYSGAVSGTFALLAERRLHLTLDWQHGERHAIEDLATRMDDDEGLFVRVLELAIESENLSLGYSVRDEDQALRQLDRILTESGSVWRLDSRQLEVENVWRGKTGYRTIRTLQRRTSPETADALQEVSRGAPAAAVHLANAWGAAFGRNPDPSRAYSEAIKAVEAVAVPVVLPNDPLATLGKVIGQLRSTQPKWQVILAEGVTTGGNQMPPIAIITNLAALLWVNQTDRHGPVRQPIQQAQAEMAVHLALTLVQAFTKSIS